MDKGDMNSLSMRDYTEALVRLSKASRAFAEQHGRDRKLRVG
jgi:hypothetical protein